MPEDINPNPETGEVEAERPEWLPSKFDSPEKLAKAYGDLERQYETTRERAKYADTLEEQYAQLQAELDQRQQTPPQGQPDPQFAALAEQYGFEPEQVSMMVALSNHIADQKLQAYQQQTQPQYQQSQAEIVADMAFNSLKTKYGESFEQASEQIAEKIRERPWLLPEEVLSSPQQTALALETVYHLVNPQAALPAEQQTTLSALSAEQQSQLATMMKQQAQTAQGAGVRPPAPDADQAQWERVKQAAKSSIL